MADKFAKKGSFQGGFDGSIEFAYVSLTEAHDRAYETWVKNDAGTTDDLINILTNDGYIVSVSQDLVSDGFKCSFTTKRPKHINNGICITSWSDSPLDALYLNFWKTYVLFEGKRAPVKAEGGGRVRR